MNGVSTWILSAVLGFSCVHSEYKDQSHSKKGLTEQRRVPMSLVDSNEIEKSDKILNVKEFGAKGDGKTNDTKAVTNAISALNESSISTLFFPNGTYIIDGVGIDLQGKKIDLLGQSKERTIIKGKNVTNIFVTKGVLNDSLIIRNIKFDATDVQRAVLIVNGSFLKGPMLIENCIFLNANLYNLRLEGVSNAIISNNTFRGLGQGKGMGIYLTQGCNNINITHNEFLYLYNGVYIVGRNAKTKKVLAPNTNITFTNNYLDFGWFLLPYRYSNGGKNVTYTANSISDNSAHFGEIEKKSNVRVLKPLATGRITEITKNVKLADSQADYLKLGVKAGDLVRIDNKSGIIKAVGKNVIEVEKWFNQDNLYDVAAPASGSDYSISRIIIGKVNGNTANVIKVTRFYDFFGNIVTPKSGWRYEVLNPRPNYPFFSTVNNRDFTIADNIFMRGWSDQVSVKGDQHKIINNLIKDGQDMGITLHGNKHQVLNNDVIHQRTGIWVASSNSVIQNNNIADCQWGGYYVNRQIGYIHMASGKNNTISKNNFERIHVKAEKNIKAIIRSEKTTDNTVENNKYHEIK